jgi:hypothetical protein
MKSEGSRSGIAFVARLAATEELKAERLERRPGFDQTDAMFKRLEAAQARVEAERLRTALPDRLAGDASTEIVPAIGHGESASLARLTMVDTLTNPDTISVDASEQRVSQAHRAGVLSPALDAAKTASATNSLEKMLCHQLAAIHDAGMDLLIRYHEANELGPRRLQVVDQLRYINGAVRCFDSYQAGCLALQKLKTGGKQHVVVQYQQQVNVANGGQAVVAAKVRPDRTRPPREDQP